MNIMIFHASAGHGHRKVAEVLAQEIRRRARPDVRVTVEDSLDSTSAFFKKSYIGTYLFAVTNLPGVWGWCYDVLDKARVYALVRPLRTLLNRLQARRLLARVIREAPDVIVSTHFLTAELFASAKLRGALKSKLITVITDFMPHTFWVNPGTDVYWVMGRDGAEELLRRGVDAVAVQARGIPIDPSFKPQGGRDRMLRKFGLEPSRLTLLLTSGSFGLGPQEAILNELAQFRDRIQCFVVCGNNAALKAELEKKTFGFPVQVFGFVDFMNDLMEASDLLIAKSGGATTTESLAKGAAMVVLAPIPGQETRNAEVLKKNNAAFFMVSPDEIRPIVGTVLANPALLEEKHKNIAALAKPEAASDLASFILEGRLPD
ncbi:MAG: glycosyltransferase [Candidatus Omnitrophota bacterium]|jgi:processive 1,2-diacylglycerol beta-glucosyltransferase